MRSSALKSMLAILLAIAFAVPAAADDPRPADVVRAREIATAYADCVVARRTALAVEVVVNDLSNDVIMARYRRLNDAGCMTDARSGNVSGLTFPGDTFRYMLGEGLVRLHYRNGGPADLATAPALARTPITAPDPAWLASVNQRRQEEATAGHERALAFRAMALLAECVIRRQPETVRQLAMVDPATPEETRAFTAIQPDISACLPADSSVRLNRATLRGALLLNYYRLAHSVQPAPGLTQTARATP